MTNEPLSLRVRKDVLDALVVLLRTATLLSEGDRVIDRLPPNPWSDLNEFRRSVYLPLHGTPATDRTGPAATEILVRPDEVALIRGVVDRIAESYSGGVPWGEVTEAEQQAIEKFLARVPGSR